MRNVGLASASLAEHTGGLKQRAELMIKYQKAAKELSEVIQITPVYGKTGKIVKLWQEAEEMIFAMSRADGRLTMQDFWKMNVYEFMRYKQLLTQEIKRKARK